MMEQTYLERCKVVRNRDAAAKQTQKLMDEVVRYALSGNQYFDPEVAKIDRALSAHLTGEVRRTRQRAN